MAVLFNFVHFINNEPRIKITTLDVGEREREREERWDVIGQLSLSRDRCLPLTQGPRHHPSIGCLFLEEKQSTPPPLPLVMRQILISSSRKSTPAITTRHVLSLMSRLHYFTLAQMNHSSSRPTAITLVLEMGILGSVSL